MTDFQNAVIRTLIYSDIFSCVLTKEEVFNYLENFYLSKSVFEEKIQNSSGLWLQQDGFLCLPGREKLIVQRKRHLEISQRKMKKAQSYLSVLRKIPYLRMIGVTGSLAVGDACEDDDIDLLFISADRRMWLMRLGEKFLTESRGWRRQVLVNDAQSNEDKLCPNMYMDASFLELPHQDLFTARELAQMKVVYDQESTYSRLLYANEWIQKFLPNWWAEFTANFSDRKSTLSRKRGGDLINQFVGSVQKIYMVRRKTKETVTDEILMFHPNDQRKRVMQEFEKRTESLN